MILNDKISIIVGERYSFHVCVYIKGITVDSCIYTNVQCLQDSVSTKSFVRAVALTPKFVSVGFTADGGTYGMSITGTLIKGKI